MQGNNSFRITAGDRYHFNTADQYFTVGQNMDQNDDTFDVNGQAVDRRKVYTCLLILQLLELALIAVV